VKLTLRLLLASALLSGAAISVGVAPTLAAAPTHNTITVTCSNGYTRTVSAHAARGVAQSLTKYSRFNHSDVTCTAGPGAPRVKAPKSYLTITCTDGYTRRVSAHAANGQAHALTNFNKHNHSGVTCAAA
jgi:hypothetical protein